MRQSTIKITIIALATSVLMLALVWMPFANVLKDYLQAIVLAGAVGISMLAMGWARPRTQNNTKLTTILVILTVVVFQIAVYLLLGLRLGFARNVYGWNLASILGVFLPLILTIILEEILRGQLIERGKGSLGAVILTGLAMWLIMVAVALPAYNLAEPKAIFTLSAVVIGPGLLANILLTYIAYLYDYRINIAYRLIMDLPLVILPVIPDAGSFLPALFQIGVVVILAVMLAGLRTANGQKVVVALMNRKKSPKRMESDQAKRAKKNMKRAGIGAVVIVAVAYVALMSGLFKYYFLAVGSGSMEPNLYRGDMVLVERTDDYGDMVVGDILVYRYKDAVIVHRIAEVSEDDGKYIFQTKGDNNASVDVWQVEQGDIIGLARGKIAMFGFPTLWLNELFNKE